MLTTHPLPEMFRDVMVAMAPGLSHLVLGLLLLS
jgi:hypothetical protein